MHYCVFTAGLPESNLNKQYHDLRYGFPVENDNELFGRLLLEINQAGLSWNTILQKESNFRAAYSRFEIASIAAYTDDDKKRLLSDSRIIRNRLKSKQPFSMRARFWKFSKNMAPFSTGCICTNQQIGKHGPDYSGRPSGLPVAKL